MKKVIVLLCISLLLIITGCSADGRNTDNADTNNEAVNDEIEGPSVNSIEDCFLVELSFEFDGLDELETLGYLQDLSKNGYPQKWESYKPVKELVCYFDDTGFASGNSYTADSIVVKKGNLYGIYDYEGNELYPVSAEGREYMGKPESPFRHDLISGVFYIDDKEYNMTDDYTARIVQGFTEDFKGTEEYKIPDGLCSNPEYLVWYNGNICKDSFISMDKPVKSDVTLNDMPNAVLSYVKDVTYVKGSAIITDKNVVTFEDYGLESFINNMVVLSDGEKYSVYNHSKKMMVTGFDFEDIKFYEDGYIPCKKDGKWGYLDKDGNVAIDFVFDDASTVYDNKAWVAYNGLYGVLDIEKALELREEAPKPIGSVKVLTKVLKVRDAANADTGNRIGNVHEGDTVDYYETVKDDTYTWYRISNIGWIADDGEWLEVK